MSYGAVGLQVERAAAARTHVTFATAAAITRSSSGARATLGATGFIRLQGWHRDLGGQTRGSWQPLASSYDVLIDVAYHVAGVLQSGYVCLSLQVAAWSTAP